MVYGLNFHRGLFCQFLKRAHNCRGLNCLAPAGTPPFLFKMHRIWMTKIGQKSKKNTKNLLRCWFAEMKKDGRSCCDRESRREWLRRQTGRLLDRDELLLVHGELLVVVVVAIVKRVVGTCLFGAVDPSRYVESRR